MKIRLPLCTFVIAAAAVAIHVAPGMAEHLQFDRAALASGELWRGMTGHLTHFEANHLIWDVGALLVLGSVAEHESRRRFIRAVLWSCAGISAAVWWWQPQFEQYRGLSGVDSALFALIAGSLLRRGRGFGTVAASVALLGFGVKCMFELATCSTVFAAGATYAPVPLAHLVGLAVGLVVAFTPDCRSNQSAHAGQAVPSLS